MVSYSDAGVLHKLSPSYLSDVFQLHCQCYHTHWPDFLLLICSQSKDYFHQTLFLLSSQGPQIWNLLNPVLYCHTKISPPLKSVRRTDFGCQNWFPHAITCPPRGPILAKFICQNCSSHKEVQLSVYVDGCMDIAILQLASYLKIYLHGLMLPDLLSLY